jgi:hypothetical protein
LTNDHRIHQTGEWITCNMRSPSSLLRSRKRRRNDEQIAWERTKKMTVTVVATTRNGNETEKTVVTEFLLVRVRPKDYGL